MTITRSKRTEFIGAHLTREAKQALKEQARKKKKSASAIVAEAVEEKLEREPVVEPITPAADGK